MNDLIEQFRIKMWAHLRKLALDKSGLQVLLLLEQVSDEVWHAGVDEVFGTMELKHDQSLADAWDIAWMTVLAIKLKNIK